MERKPCGPPIFFSYKPLQIIFFCFSHLKSCFHGLSISGIVYGQEVDRVVSHNVCVKVTWLRAAKGLVLFITPDSGYL